MKHIILFWIQWSWKWTQAKKILKDFPQYKHLEMWDILRWLKGMDNAMWDYFKQIDNWLYLDDSTVTAIFDMFMMVIKKWEYMLIDGFPRTFWQLYMFIDRMKKAQMEFEVILLDMNIDTAIDRLADRKFYRKDGYIYHIRTTEDLEYANANWLEVFQRDDDQPSKIMKRFLQHQKYTEPMLEYVKSQWRLKSLDANRDSNLVYEDLKKIISE